MGTQSHRPCVQTLSLFGTTAILALISCILAEDACSTRYPPICLDLQNCTNVDAWGLQIGIGNPGRVTQSVCMSPSTVISATYVIGKDICQDEVCRAGRGGTFDEEAVDGGFATRNEPALDGPEESLWGSLNSDVDTFGNIGFSMGGFVQLNNYEIGVVTNGTKFNLGHLGLGPHSTLLQSMKDQGLIDRLMFGFDAGSQSYSNPRPGHLVLGGIDRSRVLENFVEFDIDYGQEGSTEFRPCPFKVNIKKMDIVFSDRTRPFIDPEAGGPEACIEPYDMLFRFQPGRLLSLESEGLDGWISSDDLPNLKVNEPGWVFPAGKVEKFSLDISLGNGFQISIPTEEIQHPLRGINPNGTWETMRNYTELNIFQEAAVRNTMVFGKAFLSRVYLAVDYEAKKFYLAKSSPSGVGVCNPVPFGCVNKPPANPSKVAGYVGMALGATALLIVIALAIVIIRRWKDGSLSWTPHRPVNITQMDPHNGIWKTSKTKPGYVEERHDLDGQRSSPGQDSSTSGGFRRVVS